MIYTRKTTEDMSLGTFFGCKMQKTMNVGDTLTFTLKNNKVVTATVAHIQDGKAALVINTGECHPMNYTLTNKGGWSESKQREWLRECYLSNLPDEIKKYIVPRTIKQKFGYKEFVSTDDIWLLSVKEVFGTDYSGSEEENIQFDWFKNADNRILSIDNNPVWWWLRNPWAAYSGAFGSVTSFGNVNVNYADSNSIVVVFGFWLKINEE